MVVKNDCLLFRGDLPCEPHKKHGVHCEGCGYYRPTRQQILIIKLGAAGDVIRTTPILHGIRTRNPDAEITWLTLYPMFVPKSVVHRVLEWSLENVLWLQNRTFDVLYNLDKDREAIGLAKSISAKVKKGYLMDAFGKCSSADADAEPKWLTGIWDDISRANALSYPEEIMGICGFPFAGEKYIFDIPKGDETFNLDRSRRIVGMNTGCGRRWLTRLWGEENWIALSRMLHTNGCTPLLLGGPEEDELNKRIATRSPAIYLGTFSLENFVNLMNECSLIITSVTMALHIAIALEKKIILFNNIFNAREFHLYGLGVILEPKGKDCLGCYYTECPEECMSTISPQTVYSNVVKLLA